MSIDKIIEDLEKIAFHEVPVDVLKKMANPLKCWQELESIITKKEVMDCIKNGQEELVDTPIALELAFSGKPLDLNKMRENHIKKIAYFVKNKPTESISLDIGIPSMGFHMDYIVTDGNHRFAGAIIGGEKTIKCSISGSVEYMKEIGLWYPNDAYIELDKMYEIQMEERRKNNPVKPGF